MIDPAKLLHHTEDANPFNSWNHEIKWNRPTCYIDYNVEDFVVHVKYPLGKYPCEYIWYYPCVFNGKPLKLITADMTRMGHGKHGSWGVHYL